MTTRAAAVATVLALLGGLAGCRASDGGDDEGGARAAGATGEGIATADLVEAGLPTDDDLAALLGPADAPGGGPEPADEHCDAASLLPDDPAAEAMAAGDGVVVTGTDSGVRYRVVVQGHVAVFADAATAAEAVDAVATDDWDACVVAANEGNEVGATDVTGPHDDGRVAVEAPIATGPGDDTTYRAGVRLAPVGRTVVVVGYAAGGQVLDDFGDAEPVDDLVDDLAERVAALG